MNEADLRRISNAMASAPFVLPNPVEVSYDDLQGDTHPVKVVAFIERETAVVEVRANLVAVDGDAREWWDGRRLVVATEHLYWPEEPDE